LNACKVALKMSAVVELPESKVFSPHEIKLIRGTYAAMARLGAQQLSLRRVAKEIGVSPQLLVYHFGSRENLLVETMRWACAGTVRRIHREVAGITEPDAALSALIDAVFVGPQANRDFHLVYMDLVQYAVRHPSFSGLSEMLRENIDGSYAGVIRAGVDAGVFHVADVDLAARQARSIVEGGFLQWLQTDDWIETHAALRSDSHNALLTLLGADGSAPSSPRRARSSPRRSSR
jgi:AcrR family transcriptional regulator